MMAQESMRRGIPAFEELCSAIVETLEERWLRAVLRFRAPLQLAIIVIGGREVEDMV
jgi:hypothetical protein